MDGAYTLTLLIYSGRENPQVTISKQEFDLMYSELKKTESTDGQFLPPLGDIGFCYASSKISVELYRDMANIKDGDGNSTFHSQIRLLKDAYEHFFKYYHAQDAKLLKELVNVNLLL